ncbi:MAG: hypothetical protein QXL17_02910 [Candidatus Thermoplasmatota archaeon]
MKLQHEDRPIERGGDLVETQFKIKATAKAFAILSSGLYTNKIRAIIRELACNAYDSHVAAGKKDTPIEIKLPTALEPTFYVKDFGTGLDHDGVTQLYTTYFESTKQDSNDFIGALGLGSKSPFSYTSSFNVEARHNGVVRHYTAFINEQGTPAITKIAEKATAEPNGLTVSLQVKREDCTKFETEAKHALMYFHPLPNILGREKWKPHSVKHTVNGGDWKLRETDEYTTQMSGPYVLQGFVAYPIDANVMRQNGLSNTTSQLLNLHVDLVVPIGEVEVAASREALSYTKQTVANIKARLDRITAELHSTVQKEFDNCTTLWEARMKYVAFESEMKGNEHLRDVFRTLKNTKPFKWNGKSLSDEVKLDVGSLENIEVVLYYKTKSNKALQRSAVFEPGTKQKHFNDKQKTFQFGLHLRPNLPVLIDDLYGGNDILRQWLDDRIGNSWQDKYALVFRPLSRKVEAEAKQEIITILDQLGSPTPLLVSALPYQRTKKSYYKKRAANMLYKWSGFASNGGYKKNQIRRSFSKLCWTTKEVDFSDGGFYVPTKKFAIMRNGAEQLYFDEILSSAASLGLIPANVEVIGMSEKELADAQDEGEWTNVFDHIAAEFAKVNKQHEMSNVIALADIVEKLGRGMSQNIIVPWKKLRDDVVDCDFKKLLDGVLELATSKHEHGVVRRFLTHMKMQAELDFVNKTVDDVMAKWKTVKTQYEMFDLINWSNIGSHNTKVVVNYINTVEKSRKKS